MSASKLFEEFQSVDKEQWLKQIEKDLKGKPFENLLTTTRDNITIHPVYQETTSFPSTDFRKNKNWKIVQEILVTDTKEANKQALDYLNRGATALLFYLSPETDVQVLLENILIEHIQLHLISEGNGSEVWSKLDILIQKRHLSYSDVNITINQDCLENIARSGNWFKSKEEDFKEIENLLKAAPKNVKTLCINANLFANAGATISQQLGITLSMIYEYVYTLNLKDADSFWINFAVGSDYFGEIAKIRAFRKLWRNLLKELSIEFTDAQVYCETSLRNKTILDAYNNMIRSSTEAMSAIIGGCDEFSSKGFNLTYEEPTAFGERIAKNQQSILQHESHLDAVQDISNGSYYIETLTEELAQKAWEFFKEIEQQGGYINALENGWLQSQVENEAEKEQKAFNKGSNILIGANKYQKNDENLSDIIKSPLFYRSPSQSTVVKPIVVKRLSEELEKA